MLAFFRRQNGRAFFPPLPIAALLPRSWRGADSNGDAWDVGYWRFAAQWADFFFAADRYKESLDSFVLGYFCNEKGQRGFSIHAGLFASHEARRRMAVFSTQLSGNYTRPASREACCRAAVKPGQAACRSTPLRAKGAQFGVKGHCPLVSSSWRRGSRRGTSFRRGRTGRTGARSRWR